MIKLTVSMDRSQYPVKKLSLSELSKTPGAERFTAEERLQMVWQITLQAWMFMTGKIEEPRMRRDIVRTFRGRRLGS